jgi:hypothetical protein
MGNFRIEIDAVGGHGCQREVKDGGTVAGCGQPTCPDCLAREFVAKLKSMGVFNYPPQSSAKLIHWPGQQSEVRDDLLTGVRSGSF